jgi:hypothetical protein
MVGNMWEKATMHTVVLILNQNLLNSYLSTIHFKISIQDKPLFSGLVKMQERIHGTVAHIVSKSCQV